SARRRSPRESSRLRMSWRKLVKMDPFQLESASAYVGFGPLGTQQERNAGDMETLKLFPTKMYLAVQALRDREEGQAMVEYALILSMVSVGAIAILSTLGTSVSNIFNSINNKL